MNPCWKFFVFRSQLSEILDRVHRSKSRATVMRHGEPVGVLMSVRECEELDRLAAIARAHAECEVCTELLRHSG